MSVGTDEYQVGQQSNRETAIEMASQLSKGFQAHDDKCRDKALEAFTFVDRHQFPHLDEEEARHAAAAFVDALWAKDEVEFRCLRDGDIDRGRIVNADYSKVKQKLRERAWVTGADPEYARLKTEAWRQHKAGGDYWTPFQHSQVHELRAALGSESYPDKPRGGQAGPGPEPMRYVLAFELHDMKAPRYWQQGKTVMIPYFEHILTETTHAND